MTSTNATEGARSHARAQAQRVWNHRHPGHARSFEPGTPWLLRYFDRVRFYPVSAEGLLHLRAEMAAGRGDVTIEDGRFSLADYIGFLDANAQPIADFRRRQAVAFAGRAQGVG